MLVKAASKQLWVLNISIYSERSGDLVSVLTAGLGAARGSSIWGRRSQDTRRFQDTRRSQGSS